MTAKISKEEFGSNLEELKKQYNILKKKYDLPEFTELNELFDIEEVDVETEFLLKRIRRVISEKITGYLRFIEIILNPSNAPMFFFKIVKKLDGNDREKLALVYEQLGNLEIRLVSLDLSYSEKNEAEHIKNLYKTFKNKVRKEFLEIIEKLNNGKENFKRSNGSYLG